MEAELFGVTISVMMCAETKVSVSVGSTTSVMMCRDRPAHFKGSTSSSITFDPAIGQTQEKNSLKELLISFQMTI